MSGSELTDISTVIDCSHVQHIELQDHDARKIPIFRNCYNLTSLYFLLCNKSTTLSKSATCLAACSSLHHISIGNFFQLQDISTLGVCRNLAFLDIWNNSRITTLSVLSECSKLANLQLVGCFPDLVGCSNLTHIKINDCHGSDLYKLANCPNLIQLAIHNCDNLTDVSALTVCHKLTQLTIIQCRQLDNQPAFSSSQATKMIHDTEMYHYHWM